MKVNSKEERIALYSERIHEAASMIGKPIQEPVKLEYQDLADELKVDGYYFISKTELKRKFKYMAGINGSYVKRFDNIGVVVASIGTVISVSAVTFMLSAMGVSLDVKIMFAALTAVAVPLATFQEVFARHSVDYVGDIPDSITGNIDKVRNKFGINQFTVHSCEPLPVQRIEILQKNKVVMVGWIDNETGVVIGIWGRDN